MKNPQAKAMQKWSILTLIITEVEAILKKNQSVYFSSHEIYSKLSSGTRRVLDSNIIKIRAKAKHPNSGYYIPAGFIGVAGAIIEQRNHNVYKKTQMCSVANALKPAFAYK